MRMVNKQLVNRDTNECRNFLTQPIVFSDLGTKHAIPFFSYLPFHWLAREKSVTCSLNNGILLIYLDASQETLDKIRTLKFSTR